MNFQQIRIISDKNKMNILNCFELEKPLTVTGISEKLNITYSRMNYHIKILENAGLLEVVGTKIKSGIVEKHYLPYAQEFKIDKSVSVFDNIQKQDEYGKEIKKFYNAILKSVIEDYKSSIKRSTVTNQINMVNSVIFLQVEDVKEVRDEFEKFFNNIIKKYGNIEKQSKAYGIINFLLPKKNQSQYYELENVKEEV